MKLTVFQSDKGDCLLLETADGGARMLIDGGMRDSYSTHVAPALARLRKANKKIDVVYVSHIDQDHIAGVLCMLDDAAAWRVHEHHINHGNPDHPKPDNPRPPEVSRIWHNSFHDTITENRGAIESMLAATAEILSGADDPWLKEIARDRRELATSIPEAMRVSSRIKKKQLNVELNPEFQGRLMQITSNMPALTLGSITFKLLGPFAADLRELRREWDDWLRDNQERVKKLRVQAKAQEDELSTGTASLISLLEHEAILLGEHELALAKELGDREKVTAPNLASLMFLAEEDGQTALLTGDGHFQEILRGLEHHDALDAQGKAHVTLLKVQHHGSEHNWHPDFGAVVTADNYLFCGNGEHENPEPDVIQDIFDGRKNNDNLPYKFWFNSSSALSRSSKGAAHMKVVEELVAKLKAKSNGRLTNRFITGSSMQVLR